MDWDLHTESAVTTPQGTPGKDSGTPFTALQQSVFNVALATGASNKARLKQDFVYSIAIKSQNVCGKRRKKRRAHDGC
jgi:hypothetical protein